MDRINEMEGIDEAGLLRVKRELCEVKIVWRKKKERQRSNLRASIRAPVCSRTRP
jgi:hypothetical protein